MAERCELDPNKECNNSVRIRSLETSLNDMRLSSSDSHHEIFERLNRIERENAVMDERYGTILEKLDTLTAKVEALEAKPARRWDGVVDKALLAAVGALVLMMLARMGIG